MATLRNAVIQSVFPPFVCSPAPFELATQEWKAEESIWCTVPSGMRKSLFRLADKRRRQQKASDLLKNMQKNVGDLCRRQVTEL